LKTLLSLAAIALTTGCATAPPPVHIPVVYDAAQAQAMLKPGGNTVTGSALIRQQGGGIVTCAGNEVVLVPATEYAKYRINVIYGSGRFAHPSGLTFTPDNGDYMLNTRRTTCNAQGFFKFEQVSDGEFFVTTRIIWKGGRNNDIQGGALLGRVNVRGGQALEVTMAP
jgi:hypothetical protein